MSLGAKGLEPDLLLVLPVVDDVVALSAVLLLPQLEAHFNLELGHAAVFTLSLDITCGLKETV
mgnify:CR=1 FL=1